MRKSKTGKVCVGVDLHKHQLTICALDSITGEVLHTGEYATSEEGYQNFINKMHDLEEVGEIELAVETTGNAKYFKNKMEAEGFYVLVVNTNKFKVISTSTSKTDANDALTLAYYLSKEMLPKSYLCDQTSEEIRRMLKTRSILVSTIVKIKNQIHGMMLGYGVETNSAQFQSKKKRQELINYLTEHKFSQFTVMSLKMTLDILDKTSEEIKSIEETLKETLKEDETIEILETVPGIGFIGAATIVSYVNDIKRFDGDFKKFSSYLGIVPGVHNSAGTEHYGHITKRGPQELRTAFVQVAMGVIRQPQNTGNWKMIEDYKLMKINKGTGRAVIALTRKMARIVFVMLNTKQRFNYDLIKLSQKELA